MKQALRWLWKVAPWLLAITVLVLLAQQARSMDWGQVMQALRSIPLQWLLVAAALAFVSHLLVSSFDLISRRHTGHQISRLMTVAVAGISYAFNLSFGAILGGMGMRLRLYTRLGLSAGTVGQVIAITMTTNWLGYGLLTGVMLLGWPPTLPASWPVSPLVLQVCGAAMTLLSLAYVLACGFSKRRHLSWREHRIELPGLRMALLQALLSCINWLLMSAIIWTLLGGKVGYGTVTSSLLLAAIAGVVTHVPAGLGVLEAVFITTLGSAVPKAELLAALLAYRAVYYLMPLAWALPGYLLMEAGARERADVDPATSVRMQPCERREPPPSNASMPSCGP